MTPRLTGLTALATVDGANLTWKTTAGSFDGTHVNYRRKGLSAYATVVLPVKDRSYSITGMEAVPYEVKVELSLHGKVITGSSLTTFVTPVAKPKPPPVVTSIAFDVVGDLAEVTGAPVGTVTVNVALCVAATGDEGTDSPWPKPTLAEAQKGIASIEGHEYVDMQALDINGNPLGNWAGRQKVPFVAPVEPTPPVKPTPPVAGAKRFGTAVTSAQLAEPAFAAFLLANFQSVTARWEMKWAPMQGSTAGAQAIAAFCVAHGISCRLHNGLWPAELPANLPTSKAAMESMIRERLKTWLALGKGIVDCCADVTNEFFTNEGATVSSPFLTAFGGDIMALLEFIYTAAREVCAEQDLSIRLVMNEYGGVEWSDPKKTAKVLEVAGELASLKLLDDLGDQYHPPNLGGQPSQAGVESFATAVIAKTLGCQFTEIALPGAGEGQWANLFKGALDASRMTIWGPRDEDWDEGDATHAMPFNDDYSPKPAIVALVDAWQGVAPPVQPTPPVEPTPPAKPTPTGLVTGIVANSDPESAQSVAALALGAKIYRWEFSIDTPASTVAAAAKWVQSHGCVLQPLIGFQARIPSTAECQALSSWPAACAPYGVTKFEGGNELNAQIANNAQTGKEYGQAMSVLATALGAGRLLVQLSDFGTGSPAWIEGVLAGFPTINEMAAGATIHAYTNQGSPSGGDSWGLPMLERMVADMIRLKISLPVYCTEWGYGVTEDGLAKTVSWATGAAILENHMPKLVKAAGAFGLAQLLLYEAHDNAAEGQSSNPENYMGAVNYQGNSKGAFTAFVKAFLAQG